MTIVSTTGWDDTLLVYDMKINFGIKQRDAVSVKLLYLYIGDWPKPWRTIIIVE